MKILKPIKGLEKAVSRIEGRGEQVTYKKLSDELGVSYYKLYKSVFLDLHETIDADVYKLLDGRKLTAIAAELGVSRQAVYQAVVRFCREGKAQKINGKYWRVENENK